MKNLIALALLVFSSFAHAAPAKHGMILVGEDRIFASHIVYKQPHNFQVILEVELPYSVRRKYIEAQQPDHLMIFVLDAMDLKELPNRTQLTGGLFIEDPSGQRTPIVENVRLSRSMFKVVYFEELPLDLTGAHHSATRPGPCE